MAASWLSRRDWFCDEMRARLESAGLADAEAVVSRLVELGLLSDERLARFEASKYADKGWSDAEIGARLRSRGCDGEAIGCALSCLEPERERAARAIAGPDWTAKGPGKAARYLSSRGFEEEAVRAAVEERFSDSGSDARQA